mgnify:FL=1
MNNKLIQRITALLIFIVGFVFAILGLFGVDITVNQADVNNVIFGLGTVIAALIEFAPMIYALIKDKKLRELLSIVNEVVWTVEGMEGLTGPQKKEKALQAIAKICEERGIDWNTDQVNDMIESMITIWNIVVKPKN